jgi:cation:H+ antiporter
VIRRELPMMILALAAAMVMAFDIELGEARDAYSRGDGLVLLLFFVVFSYYTLGDLLRQRGRRAKSGEGQSAESASPVQFATPTEPDDQSKSTIEKHRSRLTTNFLLIGLGLAGLTVGGNLVVTGGVGVARALGIPEVVVGLTMVSVGTSLPELAASFAALRRNQIAIAVGGVVGSNIFNTLLVAGTTAAIKPMPIPAGGHIDLAANAVLSLALLFVARSHSQRITRYEGFGLLVLWAGYLIVRIRWLSL